MKKFLLICSVAAFALYSCQSEITDQPNLFRTSNTSTTNAASSVYSEMNTVPCGEVYSQPIFAGQHYEAGNFMVYNDGDNLHLTYTAENNWFIDAVHLYVGSCAGMPLTGSGNPQIGQFNYHSEDAESFTSTKVEFVIPLTELGPDLCIAAHAEVHNSSGQSETAWSFGNQEFPGNRWGWFSNYEVQECLPECSIQVVEEVIGYQYTLQHVDYDGAVTVTIRDDRGNVMGINTVYLRGGVGIGILNFSALTGLYTFEIEMNNGEICFDQVIINQSEE